MIAKTLREAAWAELGIPENASAALYQYAAQKNLGAPVTAEREARDRGVRYVWQGFAMGIAYVEWGQWDVVRHVPWF